MLKTLCMHGTAMIMTATASESNFPVAVDQEVLEDAAEAVEAGKEAVAGDVDPQPEGRNTESWCQVCYLLLVLST